MSVASGASARSKVYVTDLSAFVKTLDIVLATHNIPLPALIASKTRDES